ncbi:MAG: DMT family transporter [Pelagimonas sp.]|nr:DMT family transporter [Pelagimonas sp.]
MTDTPDITAKSWLMVCALGIIWGATFMFIAVALEGITPFWLASGRIGFATLLTGGVWWALGGRLFLSDERRWAPLVVIGVLSSALPFMLISWGQQFLASGFVGVSMSTIALQVMILSHFVIPGERITARRAMGLMIGFAGVVVLFGNQALQSSGDPLESLGRAACIGAAACYAISSVMMRRLPPVDPVGLSAITLLFGALVVIPMAWAVEGPPPMPDGQTLVIVAVLGLIPTAGANLLRVLLIRSAGPVFMSLTNYQVPAWSVIFGIVFLNEPFRISLILALALILLGVGLSQYGALRQLFARSR